MAQASLIALLAGTVVPAAQADPPGKPVTLPRWRKPADPEPLVTAEYLEVTVARQKGELKVLAVKKRSFARPQLITRFRGRFEVRLLSPQRALRDVVRFDLPLTGGADQLPRPEQDDALARKLSLGVSARTLVRVPIDSAVASAYIYDQLTHRSVPVDLSRVRSTSPPLALPVPKLAPPVPPKKVKDRPKVRPGKP